MGNELMNSTFTKLHTFTTGSESRGCIHALCIVKNGLLNLLKEFKDSALSFSVFKINRFQKIINQFHTLSEATYSPIPIGRNTRPIIKNVGKTVLGVRMGCHAFNRCCLKAVSSS